MLEGLFQPMHLIVILAIILVVFGPGKLPQIGADLGKGIREFKKAVSDNAEDSPTSRTSAMPGIPAKKDKKE